MGDVELLFVDIKVEREVRPLIWRCFHKVWILVLGSLS